MTRFFSVLVAVLGVFSPMLLLGQTPVPVTVSVAPQAYFVKAIGGDRVSVDVMVKPGQSSHTFSPSPRQLMALADGRVYVKAGHPDYLFEQHFLERLEELDRDVRVVDMSEGVAYRELEDHGHPAHAHDHVSDHEEDGHDGRGHQEQAHGETDPHVWVSPRIVRATAHRITEALIGVDPDGRRHYESGLQGFLQEIDTLDAELRTQLSSLSRRVFLVNHPAWGYFADDYGLEQRAIESEGKDASPARLAELIERARADGIRAVFVQAGFSSRGADVIARELGAEIVSLDPMSENWTVTLRTLGHALVEGDR
ncbi:MAG: zinc ABC transporter substrate-binding protein [Aquisalimonadaceae bacterium]